MFFFDTAQVYNCCINFNICCHNPIGVINERFLGKDMEPGPLKHKWEVTTMKAVTFYHIIFPSFHNAVSLSCLIKRQSILFLLVQTSYSHSKGLEAAETNPSQEYVYVTFIGRFDQKNHTTDASYSHVHHSALPSIMYCSLQVTTFHHHTTSSD